MGNARTKTKNLETVVFIAMSLDGYIATKDHSLSWLESVQVEGEDYGYSEFMKTIDALVMGRNTYDTARGFDEWPFEGKKVVVFTHRPFTPIKNEKAVSGSLSETLESLSSEGVRRVYLDGGTLIRSGLAEGVVDRITLSIVPILLGDGIPLFQNPGSQVKLESIGAKHFPSGLVQLSYKVI